jgi:hypothetical protein
VGFAPPAPAPPAAGPPVAPLAALTRLWRSVYQKAGEIARVRAGELVAQHVYHLHGVRAVAVVFDGGGTPLVVGDRCDLELPWAYVVEGWALYADQPGTLALDVRACAGYGEYPAFASVVADAPPGLGDPPGDPAGSPTDKGRDDELTDWVVRFPRGTVLRLAVAANDPPDPGAPGAAPTRATLTLYVRAF